MTCEWLLKDPQKTQSAGEVLVLETALRSVQLQLNASIAETAEATRIAQNADEEVKALQKKCGQVKALQKEKAALQAANRTSVAEIRALRAKVRALEADKQLLETSASCFGCSPLGPTTLKGLCQCHRNMWGNRGNSRKYK